MKIQFILQTIIEAGQFNMALLDIMTSDYCTTHKKLKQISNPFYREVYKDWNPKKWRSMEKYQKTQRQKFYNILAYLRRKGLVAKIKNDNKQKHSYWIITAKGKSFWKKKFKNHLSSYSYKKEPTKSLIIVIFDIMEKERKKRDWLRQSLISLEFKQLQKSVWIGRNKLPEELLQDIKNLNIWSSVEIFTIQESGTIYNTNKN